MLAVLCKGEKTSPKVEKSSTEPVYPRPWPGLECLWTGMDWKVQLQRILARKYAMLRKNQSTSRLGLSASRGSEYSRLGSKRTSRTGSSPLRFFWITPSLVPMLPQQGQGAREERGHRWWDRQSSVRKRNGEETAWKQTEEHSNIMTITKHGHKQRKGTKKKKQNEESRKRKKRNCTIRK